MMKGRYELKFVVDAATKRRFLDAIRVNLVADPHGRNAVYRVSSLYFDTPDYEAYWAKLDGESVRRKYRLRYYSIDDQTRRAQSAFMEIKHRVHNTLYKQRVKLTELGADAILTDNSGIQTLSRHVDGSQTLDQTLIDEVQRLARQADLQGAAVITYLREAWQGKIEDRLRVTFDTRCQAYPPSEFADVYSNRGISFLPEDRIVMEIKFDDAIPCWIRDVLIDQQLMLQRFSKYAGGVYECVNKLSHHRRTNQFASGPIHNVAASPPPLLPVSEFTPGPGAPVY